MDASQQKGLNGELVWTSGTNSAGGSDNASSIVFDTLKNKKRAVVNQRTILQDCP